MRKLYPAEILRYFLIAIILGVIIGHWFIPKQPVAGVVIIFVILGFWLKDRWRYLSLALATMLLVIFYTVNTLPKQNVNLKIDEKNIFSAWVSESPSLGESSTRYIVTLIDYDKEKVLIYARRYPKYVYGDRLEISCEIKKEVFSYYLKQGVTTSCSFPEIKLLTGHSGSIFIRKILEIRDQVSERVEKLLPEPESSLLSGIWWGEDDALPPDLKENFRSAGVSHILAVSGYNVTVVMTIIFSLLLTLGLSRVSASWAVILLVIAFVVFSGGEAAVVRAGIMGLLVVVARLVGRAAIYSNLLLLAAAAMLIWNPVVLTDLGFQLSFLAMAGLLYLPDKLDLLFKWLPKWWPLRGVFIETLAAVFATAPLLLIAVDKISIISPLANLLIVPLIPAVMFGGLVIILLSSIPSVATIIAWPVYIILYLIKIIANSFSNISWATINSSATVYMAVGGLYIFLIWYIKRALANEKISPTS